MAPLYWESKTDRTKIVDALKNNKIVISSTDTILGFLANSTHESYEKIIAIKQTSTRRPFLLLVASAEKLHAFVAMESLSETMKNFITLCWPGPVTFIFQAKKNVPDFLVSPQKTIAIRCPDHDGLQAILPEFDGLFSTSANKTMETPPESYEAISRDILRKIDFVILDRHQSEERTEPSTIVDLCQSEGGYPFKVTRQGAIEEEELRMLYHQVEQHSTD